MTRSILFAIEREFSYGVFAEFTSTFFKNGGEQYLTSTAIHADTSNCFLTAADISAMIQAVTDEQMAKGQTIR